MNIAWYFQNKTSSNQHGDGQCVAEPQTSPDLVQRQVPFAIALKILELRKKRD